MKESNLYRPIELPGELSSLTEDIICNLHTAVVEHGISAGPASLRLRTKEPDLSVLAAKNYGDRMMVLTARGSTNEGMFLLKLVEAPGFETAVVLWDKRITVEQVLHVIEHASEIRKAMDASLAAGEVEKMSVDEAFSAPGTCFPILPGQSPEDLLQEFDRPDELQLVEEYGIQSIVRKSDLPYLQQRLRAAEQVLAEEGISLDRKTVENLGWKEILALREKIQKRAVQ